VKTKKRRPRNKFESRIEQLLKKLKARFGYETEKLPYLISGHYLPDFVITTNHGKFYLETKGYFRPEAKRKLAAVKKLNPTVDIRLLFYSHNPQYIRWAEKNGFKWAVDTVPQEWLDE
jgi:Uncharacterized proteins of the AP superfamily